MPTLDIEPMAYPATLFEEPPEGNWWVAHVKPRSEKALARSCYKRQAGFFLPQYRRPRLNPGRVKDAYLPLFPSYVFLFGGDPERITALETNLVVKMLPVPDQRGLFADLSKIHRVIQSGLEMAPVERLTPGTPVSIMEGPLAGLNGTVLRHKNKTTLILKVAFLQQGASVEIDHWMVVPTQTLLTA